MKKFLIVLMAVMLLTVSAIPAFAVATHSFVPSVSDVWDSETYPYAVVIQNGVGEYWFTCSTTPFDVGEWGELISSGTGGNKSYKLNSNNVWVFQSNNVSQAGSINGLIYTTHTVVWGDIVSEATPDFFLPPPPLHQMIQGVAEETIQAETLPALGGTMNILTLCGVGLMACLVVLSLFGKRSLISRS